VVVEEFVTEVARTLRWVTEVVMESSSIEQRHVEMQEGVSTSTTDTNHITENDKEVVERELKAKRQSEENKLYASLMQWATLNILNAQNGREDTNGSAKSTS
jgi:hypothetical protein